MRTVAAVLVLSSAMAVFLAPPIEASPRPRHCESSGSTVLRGSRVRVFMIGTPESHRVYACVLRTGTIRRVGRYEDFGDGTTDGVHSFAVGGGFVGYENAICNRQICTGTVKSLDVLSGAVVHRVAIPPEQRAVWRLVINRHGSLAWTRGRDVWKVDARKPTLLDRGGGIDPQSLRLHGRVVRWLHDGLIKSAALG
jgi:hypothetical protein